MNYSYKFVGFQSLMAQYQRFGSLPLSFLALLFSHKCDDHLDKKSRSCSLAGGFGGSQKATERSFPLKGPLSCHSSRIGSKLGVRRSADKNTHSHSWG